MILVRQRPDLDWAKNCVVRLALMLTTGLILHQMLVEFDIYDVAVALVLVGIGDLSRQWL